MFVQHAVPATPKVIATNTYSRDFELNCTSKTKLGIEGEIVFQYLNQSFVAAISIRSTSIRLNLKFPLIGLTADTSILQNGSTDKELYFLNGTITRVGSQNIIWLMLDLIHLYNLIRLKPAAILESYRETLAYVKNLEEQLTFGHLPVEGPIAKKAAGFLANKMKVKHKYIYSNPMNLLTNTQVILSTYPQSFLLQKTNLNELAPAISL